MTTERKSIKVKIFGSEYPLRGESEEFTRRVAAYVDEMIGNIHQKLPEQPTLTVAVLSALNISEELMKERDRGKADHERLASELSEMSVYLEDCLRESQ